MVTKAQVFMVGDQLLFTVLGLLVVWWCLAGTRRMKLAARERDIGPALARFAASFAAFAFIVNAKGLIIQPDYRLHTRLDAAAVTAEWVREHVAAPFLVLSSVIAVCVLLATLLSSLRPGHPSLDVPVDAAEIHQ